MPHRCLLKVGVLGVSYKTAPLALREKIGKGLSCLSGQKSLFFPYPTLLLSTCNRVELYFSGEDLAETHAKLLSFLRSFLERDLEKRLYSFFGFDCFLHLSKVSSGLDSAILGETEIQRQVKIAYEMARKTLLFPSSFHYVFQKAFRIAKAIRTEKLLKEHFPSLSSTLWEISVKALGSLAKRRILLVGNSEVNRAFASFLRRKGILHYIICTRGPLKKGLVGREELLSWRAYDLIVAASTAEEYLISGQSENMHLIFDLSVPRSVDPKVSISPNISLYNIEEVQAIMSAKRALKGEILETSIQQIEEHAARLAQGYREKILQEA